MNNENYIEDDELKNAPFLRGMNRENPFKVPDGYFDSFPTIISEKISSPKPHRSLVISLRNIFHTKYAMAACVLAVAIASGFFYFNLPAPEANSEITVSYSDLSNSSYLNDIDESLLTEELSKYADNSSAADNETNDIENYLIDNHTDISVIAKEL